MLQSASNFPVVIVPVAGNLPDLDAAGAKTTTALDRSMDQVWASTRLNNNKVNNRLYVTPCLWWLVDRNVGVQFQDRTSTQARPTAQEYAQTIRWTYLIELNMLNGFINNDWLLIEFASLWLLCLITVVLVVVDVDSLLWLWVDMMIYFMRN